MSKLKGKRARRGAGICIEAKHPLPRYADLDQAARDAIVDALLVLIRRGRQVLITSSNSEGRSTSQSSSQKEGQTPDG